MTGKRLIDDLEDALTEIGLRDIPASIRRFVVDDADFYALLHQMANAPLQI